MNKRRACVLLDLTEPFTKESVRKGYFKASLKHHPDKNKDSDLFLEIKEAYEFLWADLNALSPLFYLDETYTHGAYTLLKTFVFDPLEKHIHSYTIYELNPTIDNLIHREVYFLKEYDLYIPLWHHELWYEEKGLKIKINPRLPEHITIDTQNNIHVYLEIKTKQVGDQVTFQLGKTEYVFVYQDVPQIILYQQGIPILQEKIFEVSLSDLYIHL